MNLGRLAFVAVVLAVCCPVVPSQETARLSRASCLAFVKAFYGWYVPKARAETLTSEGAALRERPSAFSSQLLNQLSEFEAEHKRNQDAGLDFDWILNSQDPGGPGEPGYEARGANLNGQTCRVNVSRQRPDGKGEKISPELKFENGRWLFVNFHYPGALYPQSENLIAMIRSYLKVSREASQRK